MSTQYYLEIEASIPLGELRTLVASLLSTPEDELLPFDRYQQVIFPDPDEDNFLTFSIRVVTDETYMSGRSYGLNASYEFKFFITMRDLSPVMAFIAKLLHKTSYNLAFFSDNEDEPFLLRKDGILWLEADPDYWTDEYLAPFAAIPHRLMAFRSDRKPLGSLRKLYGR